AKKNVLTFADFVSAAEADIEDMFEPDFYLRLVNEEYTDVLSKPIALADLNNNLPRIVMRLEQYLAANPLKGGITFNHFRPARYLSENLPTLQADISPATLDRFEEAFKRLNALLKK